MNSSLNLTACKVTTLSLRIISTVYFYNLSILILDKVSTCNKICIHKTYFVAREKSEIFLRRFFHEVLSLNIKFLGKWNLSCSHLWILLIISHFHIFNLTFRIIINNKLNRIKNSHHSLNLKL